MADSETKSYDELRREYLTRVDDVVRLADLVNNHPDNPKNKASAPVPEPEPPAKPPRQFHWPKELDI